MYNSVTREPEHELGLRTFQLNPGGEAIEQRMAREERQVRERQEKQHGQTIRTLTNLGNGQVVWDVEDAAERLLTRDFPEIARMTDVDPRSGLTGQHYVPNTFLSKCAPVVDMAEYPAKRRKVEAELGQEGHTLRERGYKDFTNQLEGEKAEKMVYDKAKEHFQKTQEEMTFIHGAKLIMSTRTNTAPLEEFSEKDIYMINNTFQYILSMEIKSNLNVKTVRKNSKSALKQIAEAKKHVEEFFGKELDSDWTFIGAIYGSTRTTGKNGFKVCTECEDFLMVGPDEISPKLAKITDRMKTRRSSWRCPSPLVYRSLTKHLLYCLHASPGAPVPSRITKEVARKVQEEQGSATNVVFWSTSLYTPDQHSMVVSRGLR